jgi:hypothetical protein
LDVCLVKFYCVSGSNVKLLKVVFKEVRRSKKFWKGREKMKLKFLGVLMLCIFMLTIGSTADASNRTWVSGRAGDWNVPANWKNPIVPSGAADTAIFTSGICEVNAATGVISLAQIQGPKVAQTDGAMTWNIKSGANVTNPVLGATATSFTLSRFAGVTMTVNQSGGNFRIYGADAGSAGIGELRLNSGNATSAGSTANYNLSGGTLDVEILSRGTQAMTSANFTATGGTLVIRNRITKFGRVSDSNGVPLGLGFSQGLATLEIGNIGTVSSIYIGGDPDNGEPNGSRTDYAVGAGGVLNIDIASAISFDKIRQYGDLANTAGATLSIDLLGDYKPTDSFFDVWTFVDANAIVSTDPFYMPHTKYILGSGAFSSVPAGWTATWVDTNADASPDTLRLYIPEPTTIALLSLGLLAVRRKRNKK